MKTATRGPHGGCVIRRAALSTKVRERFWSRVRKDESCWVWVGRLGPGGYGVFSAHAVRPGPLPAHRVAFALEHGETPAGLVVMHECDNKPCVNPAHLRVGTQGENQRDAIARGLIQFPGPHSRLFCQIHGSQRVGGFCVECEAATAQKEAGYESRRQDILGHFTEHLPSTLDEFRSLVGDRNAEVFAEYVGLYGEREQTLESIGERRGVTRERIRQLTERTAERCGATGALMVRKMARDAIEAISDVGAFVQAVLLLHPTLSEIVSVSALPGRPNIIAMALGRGVSRGDMITAIGCSEALFSCFESGELYLMGDRRSRLVAYLNTLEPK